jgi:hypothetical protein
MTTAIPENSQEVNSDQGTYIHGFGRGLVKGMNLHLQRGTSPDGTSLTTLSFKVNTLALSHFQKPVSIPMGKIAEISPVQNPKVEISFSSLLVLTDIKLIFHIQQFLNSVSDCTLTIDGIGSLKVIGHRGLRIANVIKVSLPGKLSIEDFRIFLSLFGLEEAITPSRPEDIEKMKLHFLFKCLYPREAYTLERDETVATLTVEQLKIKMVALAPPMKQYIQDHPLQPVEIVPGYVRYSLPISRQVYALGGRALTAMLSREATEKKGEIATQQLDPKTLDRLIDIFRNGMVAERLEELSDAEGDSRIKTQMVWKHDVEKFKKLEKFRDADEGEVRLYLSLKALNRGSCQYNRGLIRGTSFEHEAYKHRKSILEFMTHFPFWKKEAIKTHEILIPDRIFPKEIRGISVATESMRNQIIDHLRKHQLIHNETINGIPLHTFISTQPHVPAHLNQEEI